MSIEKVDLLIGGKQHLPASGQYYPLYSPVDGSLFAEVADANEADVDAAVSAAKSAFYNEWKFCDREKKRNLLNQFLQKLRASEDELSAVKVLPGPGGTGGLATDVVNYYIAQLDHLTGTIMEHSDQGTHYIIREPLGVVAVFSPWNGPVLGSLLSIIPALVAGNTVVLKTPEEEAPQATKAMEAFHEAGFPAGVVNVISGSGPEAGKALVAHPDVRVIGFTGSTSTGKKIMASAADQLKRVQLNLGNKTPQIVFPDASLSQAAQAAANSAFPGQACSAISRILVHKSIKDEYITLLQEAAEKNGPCLLINNAAIERMEEYVALGKKDGKLLFGGSLPDGDEFAQGCYFTPTAIEFSDQSSAVCQDEIFGPILSVLEFDSDEEALTLANATDYGLIASIWTQDTQRQRYFTQRLEMGTIAINRGGGLSTRSPWGGFKQSGIGRRYGEQGLEPFLEYKTVWAP